MNSGESNGFDLEEAIDKIMAVAQARGIGEGTVQDRRKDWAARASVPGTPTCGDRPREARDGAAPADAPAGAPAKAAEVPAVVATSLAHAQISEFVNVMCRNAVDRHDVRMDTMDMFVDPLG